MQRLTEKKSLPISIIMPVHNGMNTLDLSLLSLIAQQNSNLNSDYEIIVVDDGSTDGSADHIAQNYPQVTLIQHKNNLGRIEARLSGIRAAHFDRILLIDVRVVASDNLLATYSQLGSPAPCMATVETQQPNQTALERVFECLRSAYYSAPSSTEPRIVINSDNFLRTRKGTTALFLDRQTYLNALPNHRDRLVNDDTRLFSQMIKHGSLYRDLRLKINYLQRPSLTEEIPHLFERGILFADYYLSPEGAYRQHAVWGYPIALLTLGLLISYPKWMTIILITFGLFACRRLALHSMDFLWLALYLPLLIPAFTIGTVVGMFMSASNDRS